MNILVVRDLRKKYKNGVEALRGISFKVREGEIYGLVGPNGSGKTTTLRIISTLIKPTSGHVIIAGIDVLSRPREARRFISYLPEEASIYDRLSGWENLLYFASLYTGDKKVAREIAEEGARIAGLGKDIYRRAGGYSKGMKRRVALARALMMKPKLALLDEPTSGLDVFSSVAVRETIKNYVRQYKTSVLMSSHNLLEVQHLCDRVGFLLNGRIIDEGTPNELLDKYQAQNLEEAFVRAVDSVKTQ